jgi:hypothetical protein
VATSVLITERAAQQVGALRKKARRSYDQFLQALRAHGCASLNYRLSGDDLLSKICVAHLSGALRVVTAFSADDTATIVLVGPHDDRDPFMDVYSQLYELAGLTEPPAAERTKPPCCGVKDGRRLIVFGTGGSSADDQHVAVEFVHPAIVGKRPAGATTCRSAWRSMSRPMVGPRWRRGACPRRLPR